MTGIPNLEHIIDKYIHFRDKGRYNPKENSHVAVVIPTFNEIPGDVIKTINFGVRTNLSAYSEYGISEPVIDSVCLSDQSTDGSSEELKDQMIESFGVIKKEYEKLGMPDLIPKVSYLRMHNDMKQLILKDFGERPELGLLIERLNEDRNGLYGKGINMYLTSILENSKSLIEDRQDKSSILYFDSEDKHRSVRHFLALSLPLSHMGDEFVKGAFSRYHTNVDSGIMERGGRVNAGTKGFFEMFSIAGKLPDVGYPCCGDQGFSLRLLDDMYSPRDYGIEASALFQLLSTTNSLNDNTPLLEGRNYTQVNIKGSDDAPIGVGKPPGDVLEKISDMAGQVIEGALGVIGYDNLAREWSTYSDFVDSFEEFQWDALQHYRHRSMVDNAGEVLKISGGITDEELRTATFDAVTNAVDRLYSDPVSEQERLVSRNLMPNRKLRAALGEKYHLLADHIGKQSSNISAL